MYFSAKAILCSALFLLKAQAICLGVELVPNQDSGVSLSGTVSLGGEMLFHLKHIREDRSFWLTLGEERHGIRPINYDEKSKALTASINGIVRTLTVEQSSNQPVAVQESRVLAGYSENEVPDAPTYTPDMNPPNNGAPPSSSPPKGRPSIPESLKP